VVKVAVTLRAWLIVTVQLPVPVQSPLHPVNSEELFGVAVRLTEVFSANFLVQVPEEQLIPVGSLVTVPPPVPASVTLRS
jgi:hypothetical protein